MLARAFASKEWARSIKPTLLLKHLTEVDVQPGLRPNAIEVVDV